MRRALLIGIDNYSAAPLTGCVADAERLLTLLKQHENGDRNFDCRLLVAPQGGNALDKAQVKEAIHNHLSRDADAAVLHFSGHGLLTEWGGYLVTSDGRRYDEGISMRELMVAASRSRIPEVTIFLDCCHSGALGEVQADFFQRRHATRRRRRAHGERQSGSIHGSGRRRSVQFALV